MPSIPENPGAPASTVFVIGGTGFIGYHIVHTLLARGFLVRVLTRDSERVRALFPPELTYAQGDLDTLSVEQLVALMQGCDKLVFAAGVDERAEPQGDARAFFHRANVDSAERIFTAAQQLPITHAVLLSSIFLHVHHKHPELKLEERHPYIASRVEQHRVSAALAENHFVLTTLEIPWVFGTAPHVVSQWQSLINYVRSATPLMCCRGGTNVVAVQSVAEAAAGALRYATSTSCQPIGDLTVSYEQLVQMLCHCAGRRNTAVRLVNDEMFLRLMQVGGLFRRLFNIPAGLDIAYLPELLMREIHVDNRESRTLLHYRTGLAEQAIQETVNAAPEKAYVKGWREMLNVLSPRNR